MPLAFVNVRLQVLDRLHEEVVALVLEVACREIDPPVQIDAQYDALIVHEVMGIMFLQGTCRADINTFEQHGPDRPCCSFAHVVAFCFFVLAPECTSVGFLVLVQPGRIRDINFSRRERLHDIRHAAIVVAMGMADDNRIELFNSQCLQFFDDVGG